jgi:sarcosine oxidase subunit alpha
MSGYRLKPLDPAERVAIRFAGRDYVARRGESLAAALLANGARVVARSFKYHRPRGIFGYGAHEPNAHVQTRDGMELATRLAAFDGLDARAVNCWPSPRFDLAGVLDRVGAFLPAGFYYKTFRGPRGRLWPVFEPAIRALAGLATLPEATRALRVEKRHAHCELLVVGAGAAGLAAALEGRRQGARTILIDDGAAPAIDGVRTLPRTTVLARHEGGFFVALERGTHPGTDARLWKVRARAAVLATGAVERPLVFAGNDRPGVMLLSAVRDYAARDFVACGRAVLVVCNHDGGYDGARELAEAGIGVAAVVDMREGAGGGARARVENLGIAVYEGSAIVAALGAPVRAARIARLDGAGQTRDIACDTIAMSGGWMPLVHLHSQAGGALIFDPAPAAFLPSGPHDGAWSAGSANGRFAQAQEDGARAARLALGGGPEPELPLSPSGDLFARWESPEGDDKAFVDFAADVTAADVRLAAREGYDGVELLKRYTTTGMAPDQGRLGNMNALDALARARGLGPGESGTTTFRPPYLPVPFAALADPGGKLWKPSRTTTLTAWHEANGAIMYESGANWRRPGYYKRAGETLETACARECRAVREAAGIYDSSPLGKFEIVGPAAAAFLDFVYATRLSDLAPGRGRYALQLHEDGRLFDDGIVFRLAAERFFVTTTTGNADACLQRFAYCRQVLRPDLRVDIVAVTEQWADIVLCGPRARALLDAAGIAVPRELKFMGIQAIEIFGRQGRVARAGFTGELSYEIFLPASAAPDLWRRLVLAGAEPVGSEANHVLRIEKGFISVGHEADGIAGPDDLGLGFAVHADKPDFVGRAALLRDRADLAPRPQLVGLLSRDPSRVPPEGAAILREDAAMGRGYVTASCASAALGRSLALALLEDGRARIGENVLVALPDGVAGARVVKPVFYDPTGARQRG